MTVWHALTIPLLIAGGLACGAYWLLAIAALSSRRATTPTKAPRRRFAVVIPAHNEAADVAAAVESCRTQDYPSDFMQVFVVADNCTDATAHEAIAAGAICLERRDTSRRGKGHALSWAIEQIAQEDWDALVVLDADCRLSPDALMSFARDLSSAAPVLQANFRGVNADRSAISYVGQIGNTLEKELFYGGKQALGGAVLLSGTGMVFDRDVLTRFPWRAHSTAEDVEYALALLSAGIAIHFVRDAHVLHEAAADGRQLDAQRTRWAGGMLSLMRRHALPLIVRGCVERRFVLCDAGWTLLIVSRPLVALLMLVATAMAIVCVWLSPGSLSTTCLVTVGALIASLVAYVGLGVMLVGLSWRRLGLLCQMPWVVTRLLWVTLRSASRGSRVAWVRTPRAAEALESRSAAP